MFTTAVMDRFLNPGNSGRLSDATHCGLEGIPGDGPYTRIWLKLASDQIAKGSFETYPCAASVACASLTVDLVTGKTVEIAERLEPQDLILILGGLPEGKEHCAERSVKALRSALAHEYQGEV